MHRQSAHILPTRKVHFLQNHGSYIRLRACKARCLQVSAPVLSRISSALQPPVSATPTPLTALPELTYADLGNATTYGDAAAQKVIQYIVENFSPALSNLICLVHPKLIIIGGRGKDLGAVFLEELQRSLKATGFRKMMNDIQARYGMLDTNACFKGAMKYIFDIHFDFTQAMAAKLFFG